MKRLLNTRLFCLLKKIDGTLEPGEQEMASVYDEFIYAVIKICISIEGCVPAYFTIQYTCLELQELQTVLSNKRFKKSSHIKLHHP